MSDIGDGGSAYPGEQGHTPYGSWNQTWEPGINLRTYIAIHATDGDVNAFKAHLGFIEPAIRKTRSPMELRFAFADAMIAESKKEKA